LFEERLRAPGAASPVDYRVVDDAEQPSSHVVDRFAGEQIAMQFEKRLLDGLFAIAGVPGKQQRVAEKRLAKLYEPMRKGLFERMRGRARTDGDGKSGICPKRLTGSLAHGLVCSGIRNRKTKKAADFSVT